MLRIEGLSVGYGRSRPVLAGIDAEVTAGAFVCILGRNGAGKSTLMRTIAGLQPALSGCARLETQDVARMRADERARRIAVVLTERPASAGLTVEDVVSLGRQPFTDWRGALSQEDRRVISGAFMASGAKPLARRDFNDLSDGERQRVMIAREIAQTPKLMVLDEITAFLDLPGRVQVMSLLRRHARQSGTIVLLSSHDLDLSLQLADSIWLLDGAGSLLIGNAQQLIASGAVGRAFDTDEVTFSPALGRFELRHMGAQQGGA
jgi:iron complex transport system ATP-binding protein